MDKIKWKLCIESLVACITLGIVWVFIVIGPLGDALDKYFSGAEMTYVNCWDAMWLSLAGITFIVVNIIYFAFEFFHRRKYSRKEFTVSFVYLPLGISAAAAHVFRMIYAFSVKNVIWALYYFSFLSLVALLAAIAYAMILPCLFVRFLYEKIRENVPAGNSEKESC